MKYKTKNGEQKRYEILGTREEVSRKITLIFIEGTYDEVIYFSQSKARSRGEYGVYYACEEEAHITHDEIDRPAPFDGYLIWVLI